MNKEIKLGNKIYQLELDQHHVAYKNETIYPVFKTTETVMAMGCLGRMRFVFDENGDILAEAYPMMNPNNDFEFITDQQVKHWRNVVFAYGIFHKNTPEQ
jgi:hypothetical protein